jgi:ribonuclease BN (tRNA processing enzyme)
LSLRPVVARFWGTRGAAPVAATAAQVRAKIAGALVAANGRQFDTHREALQFVETELGFAAGATYGGATCCVELDYNDLAFFICDMGSGLQEAGLSTISRCSGGRRKKYNFFLSHLHRDHVIGLLSFLPAQDAETELVIHSCHPETEQVLRGQQEEAVWPVPFGRWDARIEFVQMQPGEPKIIDGVAVDAIAQHHPGGSFGYRFSDRVGRTIVYSTDSEHKIDDMAHEEAFAAFFADADLVICDTMYSLAKSNTTKEHSGHSSNVVAIDLCHAAAAKRLALFHHDPLHDDDDIQQLHEDSIRYEELTREGSPLEVLCSYDGLEVVL